MASDGGKGSAPRPIDIPRKQFEDNWERIFGKKNSESPETVDQAEQQNA